MAAQTQNRVPLKTDMTRGIMVSVSRNAVPAGAGGVTTYHLRAWDDGTVGWVTWTSTGTPNLSPASGDTTPNYSGSLSAKHVTYTTVA